MTKTINIIADLAGRYDELMLLLKKLPQADLTVFLGDIPDRGKQTKQCIEYLMKAENTEVIRGNHDQMMVNACRDKQDIDIWYYNGGGETIDSYGGAIELVPKEHIDWLASRPIYIEFDDLFLSHAPVRSLSKTHLPDRFSQKYKDVGTFEGNFIWNRLVSKQPLNKFTIHGHNSAYKEYKWGDGQVYTICLDNCRAKELRAMHWPTREIITQEYISEKSPEQKKFEEEAKLTWEDPALWNK